MIIRSNLDFSGANHEEVLPVEREKFPYVCMYAELEKEPGGFIGWHWHDAMEIDYILSGAVDIFFLDQECRLQKGDAVFVNADVIHAFRIAPGTEHCKTISHLFYGEFLSGGITTRMHEKYMMPVIGNPNLQFEKFSPEQDGAAVRNITAATDACDREPEGYEFLLRDSLTAVWIYMLRKEDERIKNAQKKSQTDSNRMREMLEYIHLHYSEKILVEGIASAANVSTRECTRCFLRTIGASPMQYLSQYRLEQAAHMLMHTEEKIIAIADACGFSTESYFGKCFFNQNGCSPREYRNRLRRGSAANNEGGKRGND
jgi:AraC-like DNA-binding protein/quercetin dioxygenase-like cupin family protein